MTTRLNPKQLTHIWGPEQFGLFIDEDTGEIWLQENAHTGLRLISLKESVAFYRDRHLAICDDDGADWECTELDSDGHFAWLQMIHDALR